MVASCVLFLMVASWDFGAASRFVVSMVASCVLFSMVASCAPGLSELEMRRRAKLGMGVLLMFVVVALVDSVLLGVFLLFVVVS
jgi:hypothetical protein